MVTFRFDGTAFHTEATSNFFHAIVRTLESYRDLSFITGGYTGSFTGNMTRFSDSGLKTEILN